MNKKNKHKKESDTLLIGAQVLTPQMMSCCFRYTDAFLNNVETIRESAKKSSCAFSRILRTTPQDAIIDSRRYSNAISVLGARGSGKTSVIMTLRHILCVGKEHWMNGAPMVTGCGKLQSDPSNIIMPILVPQDFDHNQSLLSWIIIQLIEKAEAIEKELHTNDRSYPWANDPWKDWKKPSSSLYSKEPLQDCMDKLLSAFTLRGGTRAANISDMTEIYEYMHSVRDDAALVLHMLKLISMITDYYRAKAQMSSATDSVKEPLLFFIIDDLDLAPERSHEVLNLVLRYLQHPNVVIICGWNQELFQNHLSIELLQEQCVLENQLLHTNYGFDDVFMRRLRQRTSALDAARSLAMDNLKKAFPPAQRYEIRGLTTRQRACFPYDEESSDSQDDGLFSVVVDAVSAIQSRRPEEPLFLYSPDNRKQTAYMRIFDNKARGLANTYRAFRNLHEILETAYSNDAYDFTNDLRALLDTLVTSNTKFAPYRRGIRDLIQFSNVRFYRKNGEFNYCCDYYCDYAGVQRVAEEYNKKLRYQKQHNTFDAEFVIEQQYDYFPSILIDVHLLLNFMENILRSFKGSKPKQHGGIEFSKILNSINPEVSLTTQKENSLNQLNAAMGNTTFTFFPNTHNFSFNVCLLSEYERQGFRDQQYHLSSLYDYNRLFKGVFRLPKASDDAIPATNQLITLSDEESGWLASAIRLLRSYHADLQNIQRLAIYKSLSVQGVYELPNDSDKLETDIDSLMKKISVVSVGRGSDLSDRTGRTSYAEDITDTDFDRLLFCLRKLDRAKRTFNDNIRQRDSANKEASKNYQSITELYPSTDQQAIYYENELNSFLKNRTITPKKISYLLDLLRKGDTFNSEDTIISKETTPPKQAVEAIDKTIIKLLQVLERWLLAVVSRNVGKLERWSQESLQYLFYASSVIKHYIGEWNLGTSSWGEAEIKAVTELNILLETDGYLRHRELIRDIERLGRSLSQSSRDEYLIAVNQLSQRINTDEFLFTQQVLKRIYSNIRTLRSAPGRIRRSLPVEDNIYEVLKGVGQTIAMECGTTADAIFQHSDGNVPDIVWPIGAKYKDNFHELNRLVGNIEEIDSAHNRDRSEARTSFDKKAYAHFSSSQMKNRRNLT